MSAQSIDNLRNVIRYNLCNRCGTCVGLSEGRIVFSDKTGKYLPEILKEPPKELSDRIWNACSGKDFNFGYYRKFFFSDKVPFNVYTGPYLHISIGHATDESVRKVSASGGILSAILIWLLDKKMIEGAVVTRMSRSKPWLAETFIATTKDDIIEASQSKYIITSANEILPEIQQFKGRLAYVGLPGQVQSIRKLQALNDPSVSNIRYILGPFYGNTLHFSSIKSLLHSYGEKDYRKISKLYFRYGEWPGNMRIEMESGRIIELPKFHANYLIPFHILKNSLLCTDLSNEFTDISGGDAWAPVYEERGKGFSIIIARSAKGSEILEQMVSEGYLKMERITVDEAIRMHSHGYDLKKRGSFIRITFRKLLSLPVPDYGYRLGGFSAKRYLMEILITSLFIVLSTRPARFVSEIIPPHIIGKLFEKTRKVWKNTTRSIKQQQLSS